MFKIYKLGELGDYTIESIIELKDSIDFHPVYQRYGGIWSKEKQQLFIDTILNDFDTPKFYFNYFTDSKNLLNTSKKLYAIIDGKQRLEAIFDFINDKYPLSKEFRSDNQDDNNLKGLYYSEIVEQYPSALAKFFSYNLDIIFVDTDDEDKLEELFLRLNGGEALTNAEKRNAIGGEFNRQVRTIVESHSFFKEKIRFKNPRYQHQDLFIKIAITENAEELISFKNNVLYDFIKNNKLFKGKIASIFTTVVDNLSDFEKAFIDKDSLLSSKGVLPVYYYFYTRHLPDNKLFSNMLGEFENLRKANRKLDSSKANPVLLEYDRLNQQGVHLEKSLKRRYKIIEKVFNYYKRNISLVGFHLENFPEYEYDNENIST
jgi:hypothetical protein